MGNTQGVSKAANPASRDSQMKLRSPAFWASSIFFAVPESVDVGALACDPLPGSLDALPPCCSTDCFGMDVTAAVWSGLAVPGEGVNETGTSTVSGGRQ